MKFIEYWRRKGTVLSGFVFLVMVLSLPATGADTERSEGNEEKQVTPYKHFPVDAGQHRKVTCEDFKNIKYDVYLPPEYSPEPGKPVHPIIYTFSPGGGGMVNHFKKVAADLQIIIVGNLHYKNRKSYDRILGSWHAMTTDVRKRIRFDASAQFAGGLSGGAWAAHDFAREYAPHISGVIDMAGWLGNRYDEEKYWHPEGLLVARLTGKNDTNVLNNRESDREYLQQFDVRIKDWTFPGGHEPAPAPYLKKAIEWLLAERQQTTEKDRSRARNMFVQGRKAIAKGREKRVFDKCIDILMKRRRTPQAVVADRLLAQLMREETDALLDFRMIRLDKSRELVGFLINKLYAGGLAGDKMVFRSAFYCLDSLNVDTDKWMHHTVWILATSKKEDMKYPRKAVELARKRLDNVSSDNENLVAAVAAYSAAEEHEKAKRLFKKIEFKGDSPGKTTAENRYDAIKDKL